MRISTTFAGRYLLALLVFNLAACSAMRSVSVEDAMRYPPPPGIRQGSLVEVRTLDGQTARFRVTDVQADGLGGKPGFFRFEDMLSLKVKNSSPDTSSGLGIVLGVLGVAALVWLVANADSVSVCSTPPCPQTKP